MFQRCGFADAYANLPDANYVVGYPFDGTASFNFESYDYYYDVDLAELAICDLGNMDLGGEHSITPPIVESLARRSAQGALGVLVLDAHLDLRNEFGNTRYSHACASRRILEKKGGSTYASIGIRSGCKESD